MPPPPPLNEPLRGVLISTASLIERCPHFRGQNIHNPNVWDNTSYSVGGVSLFQGYLYFKGVLSSECPYRGFHLIHHYEVHEYSYCIMNIQMSELLMNIHCQQHCKYLH